LNNISAYHINKHGVLAYSGLPTDSPDLNYEHHNGLLHSYEFKIGHSRKYTYEVWAIGEYGLIHGIPGKIFDGNNLKRDEK